MTDWRRPARGSDCARAPVTAVGGALHDVLQADGVRARAVAGADAAVLFNSGIGTLLWPLVDAWLPTCAALLERRVPVLLTCFHERESVGEQEVLVHRLEAFQICPDDEPYENPFARPLGGGGRDAADVIANQRCWWVCGSALDADALRALGLP